MMRNTMLLLVLMCASSFLLEYFWVSSTRAHDALKARFKRAHVERKLLLSDVKFDFDAWHVRNTSPYTVPPYVEPPGDPWFNLSSYPPLPPDSARCVLDNRSVFVITLNATRARERRVAVQDLFQRVNLTFRFWPAWVGKIDTVKYRKQLHSGVYGPIPGYKVGFATVAEYSLARSHKEIMRYALLMQLPCVLICEDDVRFNTTTFGNQLQFIIKQLNRMSYDMVRLDKGKLVPPRVQSSGNLHRVNNARVWGAGAYILSNAGARRLFRAQTPVATYADYLLNPVWLTNRGVCDDKANAECTPNNMGSFTTRKHITWHDHSSAMLRGGRHFENAVIA